MKKYLLLLMCLLATGCSCNSNKLCKTYQGTLPAASSPGIKTTLILNTNGTFKKDLIYIDETDGRFMENGTYIIQKNTLITRSKDETFYYRIKKNCLRQLDMNQQEITGPLASYYVLKCIEKQ